MPKLKRCTQCGENKPATKDEFASHPTTLDRLQSHCRPCGRKLSKTWYETNYERATENARRYRERTRDGTRAKWAAIAAEAEAAEAAEKSRKLAPTRYVEGYKR